MKSDLNEESYWQKTVPAEKVRELIYAVPELSHWPKVEEILSLMGLGGENTPIDLQLPMLGCEAVGGSVEDTIPAVAAQACAKLSIVLVDGILDEDVDSPHHQMGNGRTANLALAFQAAAHVLVEQCPAPPPQRAAAALVLARMALATAAGQELDVQNLAGEERYWQVVRAKSTPFHGGGLEAGAYLGGATPQLAQQLYKIGALLGEAIQIIDDLEDAFQSPASTDWTQGRNTLPIIYGLTADYPEKETFLHLRTETSDPEKLNQAQQILIRSGAVSYCVYHLLERHRQIRRCIRQLPLVHPRWIESVLGTQLTPVQNLLTHIGLELPAQFLDNAD